MSIIKILGAVLIGSALLAGCNITSQPVLTSQKLVVVMPSAEFKNCPKITNLPNPSTLTDRQVAEILVRLDFNNEVCRQNINAIYAYLTEAGKIVQ